MEPALDDETQALRYLFGGSKPWRPQDWTSSDDRVRGGSSISHLLIPSPPPSPCAPRSPAATFTGTLDAQTLGGAGFASQRTAPDDLALDLRPYAGGLLLDVAQSDGKTYTLVLKDQVLPRRRDGRERSSVSWEAEFAPAKAAASGDGDGRGGGEKVLLRWEDFKATYRGREKDDTGELKRGEVKRVSLMCRSFFGEQEGDFEIIIRSIAAVKEEAQKRYRDDPDARTITNGEDEKRNSVLSARQGWLHWTIGACFKSMGHERQ